MTNDGTWTYSYDLDGNQVGKSKSGESWSYAYDHRGQMTQATSDTGVSVTYIFDAFGNRIERDATVSGVSSVEKFVVDGWDTTKPGAIGTENFDTILDLDGAGNVTNRRLFGSGFDDVVGRQDAAGGVKWYATDRLGSVRQVFDNAGNVSGTTDYDAFGGFLGGVSVDRYAFTGREEDVALGLQYSRGRMYDSATGRWMGEDPIRQAAGDANLYRYVGNAATNARDPSGHDGWSFFQPLNWRFQTWDEIDQSLQNHAEAGGQAVGNVVTAPLKLVAPEDAKAIANGVANEAKNAAAKGVEVAKEIHEQGKNLEAAIEKGIGEAAKGAIEPLVKEGDGGALRDLGDGIKKEVEKFREELQALERDPNDPNKENDAILRVATQLVQYFIQKFVQDLLEELSRPDAVNGVGENGFFGSLLPLSDFRDALHNFQNDKPILGTLYLALGLSDLLGFAYGAKRIGKGFSKHALKSLLAEGLQGAGKHRGMHGLVDAPKRLPHNMQQGLDRFKGLLGPQGVRKADATKKGIAEVCPVVPKAGVAPNKGRKFLTPDEFSKLPQTGTIDPKQVRFSQDSIDPRFKEGGSIEDLIAGLKAGKVDPSTIPAIRIVEKDGKIYTLDNRRLKVFQEACIPIKYEKLDAVPKREGFKFTTKNDGIDIDIRKPKK